MLAMNPFLLHLAGSASAGLFAAVWQGTVLAATIELCLRLMPRVTAAARSTVWLAVFLLVALLHLAPLARTGTGLATPSEALHVDPRWGLAVVLLWAGLSLFRAVRLAVSAIRLNGVARRATPVSAPAMLTAERRPIELCTTEEVDRPSVSGFLHARILLPPSLYASLSAPALEQILLHEVEHLRRSDDWTNLLQKLALVLFPLNPALLWIERRLCTEREIACDDRVLRATGARKAYATCLANLAEHSALRRTATLALRAWDRQSEVTRRVHRILAKPQPELSRGQSRAVMAGLILAVFGLGTTLTRAPELLSFSQAQPAEQAFSGPAIERTAMPKASMKLLKAEMPAPRAIPVGMPVQLRRHRSTVRNIARRGTRTIRPVEMQTSWLVYTDVQDAPRPARFRMTVAADQQASYAAVPTPNGWLIFQL